MAAYVARLRAALPILAQECTPPTTTIAYTLQKPTADSRFHIIFTSQDADAASFAVIENPGLWAEVGVHTGDRVISINGQSVRRTTDLTKSQHASRLMITAPAGEVRMVVARAPSASDTLQPAAEGAEVELQLLCITQRA